MNEPVQEFFGFKVAMTGGLTWIASQMQGFDLTEVLGFVALVTGVFIQVISYYRNTKADKRSIEADDRAKVKYDLEMKVLAKELAEIESRMKNGT